MSAPTKEQLDQMRVDAEKDYQYRLKELWQSYNKQRQEAEARYADRLNAIYELRQRVEPIGVGE